MELLAISPGATITTPLVAELHGNYSSISSNNHQQVLKIMLVPTPSDSVFSAILWCLAFCVNSNTY